MKIGLNATCFNDRPSGARQRFVGIYSSVFLRMKHDTFIVYEPYDCDIYKWFDSYDNVSYIKTPLHSRHKYIKYLIGLFYWRKIYKKERFDIFETFNFPLIRGDGELSLLTIHDIRSISLQRSLISRLFNNILINRSVNKADHIITVSHSMKDEISNYFPNIPISVIYNGIDIKYDCNMTESEVKIFLKKIKLPRDFILSVGHFEPRKNYILLLNALNNLHSRGMNENLVIVGNDSGEMNLVGKISKDLGLDNYVKILTDVKDCELEAIYKMSKLFVFPSFYEGFGIPILESMHYNVPFILSNIPVFREITEGKCVYFDQSNSESIADTIQSVLMSKNKRKELITYGLKRVQDFEFYRISKDLQNLYKNIL